ncbi:MAG: prenyltransferase, partial [Candidatus Latescibacteria bacterium]|nr:prenyltransferase [Candidatus Latescibacterota bacterium]
MSVKTWLKQTRADFLVLSVALVMIGGAAARHDGSFHTAYFFLTVIGVVLAHMSVNLFNEYSDWRTGIDSQTVRTPFSGGSGVLQAGGNDPKRVLFASWLTLITAFLIGCYLTWASGWEILAIMAIGGVVTVFYTDYLARWMLGEIVSGLTLGSLVVIGAYFVQTGAFTPGIVWISIPPGLLTLELLLLNEFPDVEADRRGGRRHMVIVFGKRRAAFIYSAILAAVYAVIVYSAFVTDVPKAVLISMFTAPLAIMASIRT